MSKKIEDSELQTLTLSPTNTNDDECSPFVNLASDETSFPISPPQSYSTVTTSSTVTKDEKRKVERLISAPVNSVKVAPNLRVSTPPGSTRITYSNERSNERKIDLSKISRDRPTPGNTLSQKKDPMRQMDLRSRDLEDSPQPSPGSHLAQGAKSRKGDFGGESSLLKPIPSYTAASRESSSLTPSGKGGGISSTPSSAGATLNTSLGKASTSSRVWLGKPIVRSGLRARAGLEPRQMERPTQHHNFLADVADVRQIEQGLLQLMEDFQAGNLRAFGKDSRLRQMEAIREQQERLARLHFEVGAEQDLYPPLSEEGLRTSHDNMRTLMEKLAQLSESIERLHTNTSSDRKTSSSERKAGVHQMGGGQMNNRTNEHANHTNFHSGGTAAHQTYENQHRPNNPTGTPSRNSGGNPMPHSFSTNVTNSSIHQSSPGNPRPLSGQHRSRNTPVHHTGLVKNGTVLESS
ncbi:Coiled-coil domain-containing protein 28B [Penaeus vannamei]|uniref:Coiled-coil domain-containing protein 28B n=1 Tax=Penaeus vannamei TaxID=6689 RepID=A0A423SWM7_PENVA|nr:uncharacterized protein LOC113816026 isoform X6 [Penaeus vannamei]ROT68518.1 Coiled-coil domain-containing protein 28B [Penaeus vannamei]